MFWSLICYVATSTSSHITTISTRVGLVLLLAGLLKQLAVCLSSRAPVVMAGDTASSLGAALDWTLSWLPGFWDASRARSNAAVASTVVSIKLMHCYKYFNLGDGGSCYLFAWKLQHAIGLDAPMLYGSATFSAARGCPDCMAGGSSVRVGSCRFSPATSILLAILAQSGVLCLQPRWRTSTRSLSGWEFAQLTVTRTS